MKYQEKLTREYSLTSGMWLEFESRYADAVTSSRITIFSPDDAQIFYKKIETHAGKRDIKLGIVSGVEDDFSRILEEADEVTRAELESLPREVKEVLNEGEPQKVV
jgi:hypothetical protein